MQWQVFIHKNKKKVLLSRPRNRNWEKGNILFYGHSLFDVIKRCFKVKEQSKNKRK